MLTLFDDDFDFVWSPASNKGKSYLKDYRLIDSIKPNIRVNPQIMNVVSISALSLKQNQYKIPILSK